MLRARQFQGDTIDMDSSQGAVNDARNEINLVHVVNDSGGTRPNGVNTIDHQLPSLKLMSDFISSSLHQFLPDHYAELARIFTKSKISYTHMFDKESKDESDIARVLPWESNPCPLDLQLHLAHGDFKFRNKCVAHPMQVHAFDTSQILLYAEPDLTPWTNKADLKDEQGALETQAELDWSQIQDQSIGAVWDVYGAKDGAAVRKFLASVVDTGDGQGFMYNSVQGSPLYLDSDMRRKLKVEMGIVGWRFVQRVGELVLIPAGCMYQVINVRSCVAASSGHVSLENIHASLALTDEIGEMCHDRKNMTGSICAKEIVFHAVAQAVSFINEKDECSAGEKSSSQRGPQFSLRNESIEH